MSVQFLNLTADDVVRRCSHFLSGEESLNMIHHNVDGFFLYNYSSIRFLTHTVGLSQVSAFLVLDTFRQELPQSVFVMLDENEGRRSTGNIAVEAARITGSGDTHENIRRTANT
ncbi:hypothetical protein RB195_003749 [Necator americanus]|uniref:Uncharacterized protein n=1 Tax=Necator americanus TaxID=51031 RepID=A0ABR1DQ79_NECAM